jgi:hypothetical protein
VRNISIRNATDYYEVMVEVSAPVKPLTLYNCYMEIDYLTKSNTWKTVSGYVGTVDFRADAIEDSSINYIKNHDRIRRPHDSNSARAR